MKKLVVAKILLISVVPFWMACGKTAVQSELTPTQNNEVKFLTKRAKSGEGVRGLVRLKDGQDLNAVINDLPTVEGIKDSIATEEAAKQEGVRGLIELDEGVRGLVERIQTLDEGVRGKTIQLSEEGVRGLIELDEGVRGLAKIVQELSEGVRGLIELDEGVRGKIADLQMQADEYANRIAKLEEGVRGLPNIDEEGVRGKVSLVENILVIEGKVVDQDTKQLALVVDGREKYAIEINPETMTYAAKFELNKDDMQKMIIDVVIENEVLTFLILEGQLQAYNF